MYNHKIVQGVSSYCSLTPCRVRSYFVADAQSVLTLYPNLLAACKHYNYANYSLFTIPYNVCGQREAFKHRCTCSNATLLNCKISLHVFIFVLKYKQMLKLSKPTIRTSRKACLLFRYAKIMQ